MTVKYFTEPVSSECPGGCAARAGWLMRCVVHIVGASTPTATTTSNRLPAGPRHSGKCFCTTVCTIQSTVVDKHGDKGVC